MAAIRAHGGTLAFTSGNSIAVINTRSPAEFHTLDLPSVQGNQSEKKEDEGSRGSGAGAGWTNRVLAAAFSGRGRYWAVCDDLKMLHVYGTERRPWTLLSSRLLSRRATSLTFTLDESTVVVADKSGDVYTFPTVTEVKEDEGSEVGTQGQLLLGHLSMVLDVCLTDSDRYVATCDRDEKVRLSRFPNGYNVHTFCLGHTQFVSCLVYVEEYKVLVSGSGDCTLRVWNMEGKQLCQLQCPGSQTTVAVTAQQTTSENQSLASRGDEEQNDEDEDSQIAEDRDRTAIQKLTYCRQSRLLVVSFYRLAELQVYRLTLADGHASLLHVQTVAVTSEPWDVSYDDASSRLWVLSPVQDAPLSAYCLTGDTGQKMFTAVTPGSEADQVMCTVNSKWDFFCGSLAVVSAVPSLWKTCRQDNVLDYQHRKQQRLQGHGKDRPQGHRADQQGQAEGRWGKKQRKAARKARGGQDMKKEGGQDMKKEGDQDMKKEGDEDTTEGDQDPTEDGEGGVPEKKSRTGSS